MSPSQTQMKSPQFDRDNIKNFGGIDMNQQNRSQKQKKSRWNNISPFIDVKSGRSAIKRANLSRLKNECVMESIQKNVQWSSYTDVRKWLSNEECVIEDILVLQRQVAAVCSNGTCVVYDKLCLSSGKAKGITINQYLHAREIIKKIFILKDCDQFVAVTVMYNEDTTVELLCKKIYVAKKGDSFEVPVVETLFQEEKILQPGQLEVDDVNNKVLVCVKGTTGEMQHKIYDLQSNTMLFQLQEGADKSLTDFKFGQDIITVLYKVSEDLYEIITQCIHNGEQLNSFKIKSLFEEITYLETISEKILFGIKDRDTQIQDLSTRTLRKLRAQVDHSAIIILNEIESQITFEKDAGEGEQVIKLWDFNGKLQAVFQDDLCSQDMDLQLGQSLNIGSSERCLIFTKMESKMTKKEEFTSYQEKCSKQFEAQNCMQEEPMTDNTKECITPEVKQFHKNQQEDYMEMQDCADKGKVCNELNVINEENSDGTPTSVENMQVSIPPSTTQDDKSVPVLVVASCLSGRTLAKIRPTCDHASRALKVLSALFLDEDSGTIYVGTRTGELHVWK